jgi:hypothetical protein
MFFWIFRTDGGMDNNHTVFVLSAILSVTLPWRARYPRQCCRTGVVETDMSNFTKTDSGREIVLGMQALKRIAQPDDIGGVVAFLASEDARWIIGDTIHVDGGSKR